VPHRPVEDLAFAVARFIQKGGSFVNYYMVSESVSEPAWLDRAELPHGSARSHEQMSCRTCRMRVGFCVSSMDGNDAYNHALGSSSVPWRHQLRPDLRWPVHRH
jgi:hypothetical protein